MQAPHVEDQGRDRRRERDDKVEEGRGVDIIRVGEEHEEKEYAKKKERMLKRKEVQMTKWWPIRER